MVFFPIWIVYYCRGCLFYGPPGTGKTLVARALANECSQGNRRVAFFMRKGADCLSKWVGESERQLRLLFDQVRLKYAVYSIPSWNCNFLWLSLLRASSFGGYFIRVVVCLFVSHWNGNVGVCLFHGPYFGSRTWNGEKSKWEKLESKKIASHQARDDGFRLNGNRYCLKAGFFKFIKEACFHNL